MLLIGIVLGLVLGLLLGGRLDNLASVRLRWALLILVAVLLRYGTESAIARGIAPVSDLRLPLFLTAFGALLAWLWLNRSHAGLLVAAAGAASNAFAIALNGGWMPVWGPSLAVAGLPVEELRASFHRLLPEELGAEFLLRGGPFGDLLPFPVPFLTNVASIGDVFLSAGLGWFVFTTLLRGETHVPIRAVLGRRNDPGTPAGMGRPTFLGGSRGPGLPGPGEAGALPGAQAGADAAPLPLPARPRLAARIRGHAYVRLALDARFSAFWLGQTISLFGDRLHQVALGVLVYAATESALLTGFVFLAATLPNLLLGPIAGTFVDRWDHKKVLVVSDLLRAALVLAVPATAAYNLALVYPLVFGITTVSIFFRPAKAAVVPRIVHEDDLTAANSATWTAETLADLGGYPLAGLLVAFLGPAIWMAFWIDAASYVLSALLLAALVIPPVVREADERVGGAVRAFIGELRDGWQFLRGQPSLFQNTLISALAQTSVGATLALTVVYAREALDPGLIPYPQNYAALETAIGLGNLVGGLTVGALGARLRKGPLIVGGFLAMGLAAVVLGLTGNVLLALVAAAILGIANLVYVIPTQTLFAELTPMPLMGRVIAFRSSLVFGALTGAMAASGVLAEIFPVGVVIALFGCVTVAGGLLAAALPAVRES